jgi:hypothetical protein
MVYDMRDRNPVVAIQSAGGLGMRGLYGEEAIGHRPSVPAVPMGSVAATFGGYQQQISQSTGGLGMKGLYSQEALGHRPSTPTLPMGSVGGSVAVPSTGSGMRDVSGDRAGWARGHRPDMVKPMGSTPFGGEPFVPNPSIRDMVGETKGMFTHTSSTVQVLDDPLGLSPGVPKSVLYKAKARRITRGVAGAAKSIGKGLYGLATGPRTWGMMSKFGVKGALAIPLLMAGGFGAMAAGRNMISGGYNMRSSDVAWGHAPGVSTEAPNEAMSFRRGFSNMNATGDLAFSLHNSRKV